VNNASQYCIIFDYQWVKFSEIDTGLDILRRDFVEEMDITSKGILSMKEIHNTYSVFAYINATNGYIWFKDSAPMLKATVYLPYKVPPNYPPHFDDELSYLKINATISNPTGDNKMTI
jgi:hypothetical protein